MVKLAGCVLDRHQGAHFHCEMPSAWPQIVIYNVYKFASQ